MPSATLLMPALAGLFGIANLIDIYVTTSEMPPQEPNWDLPPAKPLIVPCFLSSCCAAVMAILPGMTAAQATVVVMTVRNLGRLTDPNYIPADFEYGPGESTIQIARARIAEYRAETARMHGLKSPKMADSFPLLLMMTSVIGIPRLAAMWKSSVTTKLNLSIVRWRMKPCSRRLEKSRRESRVRGP